MDKDPPARLHKSSTDNSDISELEVRANARTYRLPCDHVPPIEFNGVELASVELNRGVEPLYRTRIAVYQTDGGKFVSEYMLTWKPLGGDQWNVSKQAQIFQSKRDAKAWFQSGPLTEQAFWYLTERITAQLLKLLDDDKPSQHVD